MSPVSFNIVDFSTMVILSVLTYYWLRIMIKFILKPSENKESDDEKSITSWGGTIGSILLFVSGVFAHPGNFRKPKK